VSRSAIDLSGKRGVVIGVANAASIATGCARAFQAGGARQILTYLNDKAEPHVRPVAEAVGAEALLPYDVTRADELDALVGAAKDAFGELDFLLHSVAFAPRDDLHAGVIDCTADGFAQAMDVSCHSFIRTAKAFLPVLSRGASLLTVSYYGAEKVVDHYNLMGPVKAALEASVRYMAADLGPREVRVNALSPGPIATRAASGIAFFDALMDEAASRAPQHRLVTIDEVGALAAFLVSDQSSGVTGGVHYVDAGYNVMA
jgi:enoyl-[acyl-carrier protein] reductase I